jgi:nuclear pore complex protein Nup85
VVGSSYDKSVASSRGFGDVPIRVSDVMTLLCYWHALPYVRYGHKLSEYLILEYGSSLFVNPSLWQVAIDYFSYCPTKGRHYMSLFIERVQLTTINKCLKVVQICHKYELKEQAQSICRVLARRAFDEGQLSTALTWCLKSGDTSFAAFLAEKYFTNLSIDDVVVVLLFV